MQLQNISKELTNFGRGMIFDFLMIWITCNIKKVGLMPGPFFKTLVEKNLIFF